MEGDIDLAVLGLADEEDGADGALLDNGVGAEVGPETALGALLAKVGATVGPDAVTVGRSDDGADGAKLRGVTVGKVGRSVLG